MGSVGRPKRYKTPEAEQAARERLKKQGERLGNLLKLRGISGKAMGEYLGVSDKAVSQYRNGRVELAYEYAEKLSQAYEYIPEYWMGETDIQTAAEWERVSQDCTDPEEDDRNRQLRQRVEVFEYLGYCYEGAGMAHFDFLGAVPGTIAPKGEHRLTPLDGTTAGICLSDAELSELTAYLKKQLAFALFDLSRS